MDNGTSCSSCVPLNETSLTGNCSLDFLNDTFLPKIAGNCTNSTLDEPAVWAYPLGACIFLIVDTIITSSWSVFANLLVLWSFFTDPKIRIIQNYYIASLALSDLMMGGFVLPLGLYQFLYQGWPIDSKPLCKFWNILDFTMSLQSSLSVCLINYDRYKMVLHPIAYRNEETPRIAFARILATWVFSWLFYGPVNMFWDLWTGYSNIPSKQCDAEFKDVAWLTTLQATIEFGGPLIFLCYCNFRLFVYIRLRRKKMVDMRKGLENIQTEETSTSHENPDGTKKQMDQTKKKKKIALTKDQEKNKAELQEFKKEQRAVRSLMVLVGTYFCLWFWYELIGNFVNPICNDCLPNEVYQASYWPQYHIAAINPIIYAITIERFRYHYRIVFSYILPCWVKHPTKVNRRKVAPTSMAAVHSISQSVKI